MVSAQRPRIEPLLLLGLLFAALWWGGLQGSPPRGDAAVPVAAQPEVRTQPSHRDAASSQPREHELSAEPGGSDDWAPTEFLVPLADHLGEIRVRVLEHDGTPCQGARVFFPNLSSDWEVAAGRRTNEDGRTALRIPVRHASRLYVAPEGGPIWVSTPTIVRGGVIRVLVQLPPAGSSRVRAAVGTSTWKTAFWSRLAVSSRWPETDDGRPGEVELIADDAGIFEANRVPAVALKMDRSRTRARRR